MNAWAAGRAVAENCKKSLNTVTRSPVVRDVVMRLLPRLAGMLVHAYCDGLPVNLVQEPTTDDGEPMLFPLWVMQGEQLMELRKTLWRLLPHEDDAVHICMMEDPATVVVKLSTHQPRMVTAVTLRAEAFVARVSCIDFVVPPEFSVRSQKVRVCNVAFLLQRHSIGIADDVCYDLAHVLLHILLDAETGWAIGNPLEVLSPLLAAFATIPCCACD